MKGQADGRQDTATVVFTGCGVQGWGGWGSRGAERGLPVIGGINVRMVHWLLRKPAEMLGPISPSG